jgi:hypothetical protein
MAALLLVLSAAGPVCAQPPSTPAAPIGSPDARVRCRDAAARRVFEQALAASPTVAQMVAELERASVIVVIETHELRKFLHGEVQVVAATPTVRYLRIRLRVPEVTSVLVSVLGHELRHALEIASMPEVRDGASLARAYRSMGSPALRDGYFETASALETGEAVAREMASFRRSKEAASDEAASSVASR